MYYVYVIQSNKTSRYYIGCTDNLNCRLSEHNRGKIQSTKIYVPWHIEYYEKIMKKK
ncbi:MAG: GIY-YIG nuclease family protein, partial [bacterium]